MFRIIENYRDLQDAIMDWLNRDELAARIPTFIYLAERRIFRRYRMPNNEKTISFDMREEPDLGEPTQLALTDSFDQPSDYLEMLTLQSNGRPLTRKSLTEIQGLQQATSPINSTVTAGASIGSAPEFFARERKKIMVWPPPTGDTLLELIYYCDLSGQFSEDEDDNDVLRNAPDLYLYGSLLQAQPFLKPEEDEWQLLPTWQKFYDEAFGELELQRDMDEYSGSVVEVQSSFSGSSRVRSGSVEGTLGG